MCVEGSMAAETEEAKLFLEKGDSLFLPAGSRVSLNGFSEYLSASSPF
jgi:mannose-6-phosphate isomerase class I